MLESFLQQIKKHALFTTEDRLLLAISGGVDSMVLWHLIEKTGYAYSVAHCNFNLRADESDRDEAFIRERAKDLNVDLFVKFFATQEYASEKGISTQMAARELRYQWFQEVMTQEKMDLLLTAHHLNDNVETVLLNQVRGTSIFGLTGMKTRNGDLVRPLLHFTKPEILDFANSEGITWREDSSNQKAHYKRNLLRHEVIPKLEALNPNFLATADSNIRKNKEVEEVFSKHIEHLRQTLLQKKRLSHQLSIDELRENHVGPLVLFELIKPFGFNYNQAQSIIAALDQSGPKFSSENFEIWIDRQFVFIEPIEENELSVNIEEWHLLKPYFHNYDISMLKPPIDIDRKPENLMLDLDKLSFPLKLRNWRQGDRFRPLGMKQHKLLSDFLIDAKVPNHRKPNIPILESDAEIVALVGLRVSDIFKVTDQTKRVLYFKEKGQ